MSTEQLHKRLTNQSAILHTLHFEGPLQRGQLSEKCGIRKSSVTSIVADLLQAGVLSEVDPGRYRSAVALNLRNHYVLVANITPRDIRIARVNMGGDLELVDRHLITPDDTPTKIAKQLATRFQQIANQAQQPLLGMGVALPGIINPETGLCLQAVNLNGWRDIPLGKLLTEQLDRRVYVDNDVRCQLQACTWFDRLAHDAENAIYLLIHDGVACSIMSRGRTVIGQTFTAGEIGHITVGDEGRICSCGRQDCLETYCSLPAILREIHAVCPELKLTSAGDIANAAENNPSLRNVLERITRRLARALAGIVAATDPAVLLLGTADHAFSEHLRPHLQRHLYSEMIGLRAGDAEIMTAGDAESGSLRGIAARVIQSSFSKKLTPS